MSTLAPRDRGAWERLAASLKPEGRAFIAGRPVAARDGRVFEDISFHRSPHAIDKYCDVKTIWTAYA
jgi:hypothetical protein